VGKIIVVTSGKGGVGKTTSSASLATGLARRGMQVAVLDFDVGLRNLDLIMGCERRVVYDFVNVIQGESTLHQALIRDKRVENLFILPASQTKDKDALRMDGVEKILDELTGRFDYVICDSPAGIEHGALMAMHFADEAVVVTNPEVSSVRDSDRVLGLLQSKTKKAKNGGNIKEHLLLTRYDPERVKRGEMLSVGDVEEILAIPLLGVIPESKSVLAASNSGEPVILDELSDAGQAYDDAVSRLLGETVPHRFINPAKKGFFPGYLEADMGIFSYFRTKKNTAEVAKNRLQIIVAHERAQNGGYEFLPRLRQELLLVVQKYVHVELDNIRVDVNRDGDCEVLEFNVTLPDNKR